MKASRAPPASMRAPSWSGASSAFAKAGAISRSTSSRVSRPPPPCASSTFGWFEIGTGQAGPRARSARRSSRSSLMPAPSRSGDRRRRRPRRRPSARRAGGPGVQRVPKAGHSCGFFQPLQHLAGDAERRLLGGDVADLEAALGVEARRTRRRSASPLRRGSRRCRATCGRRPRTPSPRSSCAGRLPSRAHGARVLVLDAVPPLLELRAPPCRMPCEQVERLEAGDDDRHAVLLGDRLVLPVAHHRADVAGGEEGLHPVGRRAEDRLHRRRHQHVRDQDREVREPLRLAPARPPWRWPARWSRSRPRRRPPGGRGSSRRASPRRAASRPCARRRPRP